MPVIVAEDDVIIRAAQVILDPDTDPERRRAVADYYSVDLPGFGPWMDRLRSGAAGLYPAAFRMVRDQDALRRHLADADGLVCQDLAMGAGEFDAAPRLRIVQKFGADLGNIDLAAAASRGVAVRPLRRRVNIAVAEHAFAMMMAMAKKLPLLNGRIDERSLRDAGFRPRMYDRRHAAGANWGRVAGIGTLHGATVGCLGLGEIGREVAARASAFGARVLYHQRSRAPAEVEAATGASWRPFGELLEASDHVSIHLPLTNATRGMIDAAAFARMKDGAFLTNISRARVIDRAALLDALEQDRLGGVALDVHYEEPSPEDEPLKRFPKALLTPHVAVASRDNAAADMEELVGNLAAAFRGPRRPEPSAPEGGDAR